MDFPSNEKEIELKLILNHLDKLYQYLVVTDDNMSTDTRLNIFYQQKKRIDAYKKHYLNVFNDKNIDESQMRLLGEIDKIKY